MSLFNRRHLIATTAAVALGSILAAWAPAASAQTTADVKKKGTLTVGLLVDFPPYGTVDSANKPDGYDADVARLLGKELGVKVDLVPVTGPNRIPYLLTNKVDILVASLAVTPERAKQVDFSRPYSAATIVLYGPKKTAIKTAADLKGLRIAVARASTQDTALTAIAPQGAEIRRFDDDASAMQALLSGQVDAIGCSTTVAAQIAQRAGDTYENKFVLKQQFMAVALRKGDADLEKTINALIAKDISNGELNKLYQKWLKADLPAMPAAN